MWFIFEILALNYRSFALIYSFWDGWCMLLLQPASVCVNACAWSVIWLIYRFGFCCVLDFMSSLIHVLQNSKQTAHARSSVPKNARQMRTTQATIFLAQHNIVSKYSTYMATAQLKFQLMVNIYTFQIVYHIRLGSIWCGAFAHPNSTTYGRALKQHHRQQPAYWWEPRFFIDVFYMLIAISTPQSQLLRPIQTFNIGCRVQQSQWNTPKTLFSFSNSM